MRLFSDPGSGNDALTAHRKWARALEAISAAPKLPLGVAHSIGGSLTYRRALAAALATENLVGRRRYHLVLAALTGPVAVDVARKADCVPIGPYSDLTDRQCFRGLGSRVRVPDGGLLIVDIEEAARVLSAPNHEIVQLHVTIEGATFHNK